MKLIVFHMASVFIQFLWVYLVSKIDTMGRYVQNGRRWRT